MAKKEETQEQNVSKDEQIGIHKGALSTLAKEREELLRIVQICEQLMQMHIKSLKDLGVDLAAQAGAVEAAGARKGQAQKTASKIDDLL